MMRSMKGPFSTLLAAVAVALLTFGCGTGDNSETVYLYVFNGYAGVESMSLYGPSGTVTTGLPFGARTSEAIEVDRNLGGNFTLVLDGAPQTFEFDHQLFSLYPQETATIILSRREDANVNTTLFRHQPAISPACRLVAHNSLSLNTSNLSEYSFIMGWDFSVDGDGTGYGGDISTPGYDESWENDQLSANGFGAEDQRPSLYDGINDHPFFVLVPAETDGGGTEGLRFIWIGPERLVDRPFVDFQSGNISTFRPSADYIQCLIDQEELDEDPDADIEPEDCNARIQGTATTFSPGLDAPSSLLHYYPESVGNDDPNRCDADFRIFSDFGNIFEGEPGFDGFVENNRLDLRAEFGVSNQFFFVLYGNPVDPRRETWVSGDPETGGGFVPVDPYPGE